MADWYIQKGEQRIGPVSDDQLREMVHNGQVSSSDLVWTQGFGDWQPAGQLNALTSGRIPSPPQTYAPPPPMPSQMHPQYGAPLGYQTPGTQITNYLPWAIVATILCCVPFGIVSIVYASKASSEQAAGNYPAAQRAAEAAKNWLIASVATGAAVTVLYFLLAVAA